MLVTQYGDWEIKVQDSPWYFGYSCRCRYHYIHWLCFLVKYDQLCNDPEKVVTEMGKKYVDEMEAWRSQQIDTVKK